MTLILGIGLGTFIFIALWIISFLLCFVSLRTQSKVGPIFIVFSALVMTVLLLIPRGPDSQPPSAEKVYDPLFIWRTVLATVLGVSAFGGALFFCKDHIMEEHYTKLLRSNNDFMEKVMNSSVPVIVNFHAEWCDPCHILTPKLKELVGEGDDIGLAIVDVEVNPDLVHTFEVKAVPAVLAIRNGLVVDKFIGLVDANMIENLVNKLVPSKKK
ncbi:hypothetical protein AAG570_008923 [Ranatra chinensis]|uniref:Thioredoxin domain-containing protein n=1 Tax=Ranatra chinensis TaxID=642074 RepID=A0ABD0YSY0_9HEMI